MITEISFTGIPVTDMQHARVFYEEVLGLTPTMESAGGKWVEYTVGASTFGIGAYGDVWQRVIRPGVAGRLEGSFLVRPRRDEGEARGVRAATTNRGRRDAK